MATGADGDTGIQGAKENEPDDHKRLRRYTTKKEVSMPTAN